jgi:hypothetical protein
VLYACSRHQQILPSNERAGFFIGGCGGGGREEGGQVVLLGVRGVLQLEGVLYACSRHLQILPSNERAGFFIGGSVLCMQAVSLGGDRG